MSEAKTSDFPVKVGRTDTHIVLQIDEADPVYFEPQDAIQMADQMRKDALAIIFDQQQPERTQ